jgi:hypothetical protein
MGRLFIALSPVLRPVPNRGIRRKPFESNDRIQRGFPGSARILQHCLPIGGIEDPGADTKGMPFRPLRPHPDGRRVTVASFNRFRSVKIARGLAAYE